MACVAGAVGVEGVPGLVVAPAVDLDDEALLGDEEVDLLAGELAVDGRRGRPWRRQTARKRSSRSERVIVPARYEAIAALSGPAPRWLGWARAMASRAG